MTLNLQEVYSRYKGQFRLYGTCLLVLGFLSLLAWRSINYVSGTRPGADSGYYLSMARHMLAGHTLYKDLFTQRTPIVLVADALALSLGDGTINSVLTLQRFGAVVGLLAFIAVVSLGFRLRWLACLAGVFLLFHFYHNTVFESGNVPEEYGAILFTLGLAAATAAVVLSGWTTFLLSALAGMAISASVLSKEPFLLYLPPVFLFLAWPRHGDWRASLKRAGFFFGGAALPLLAFLTYLLTRGAWHDWLDILALNFKYSRGISAQAHHVTFALSLQMAYHYMCKSLVLTRVAAVLGLLSLFSRSFLRETAGLPILIAVLTALGFIATTLGGRYYGHYYLQLVPVYLLLAACGAAFLLHLIADSRARAALALAALVSLAVFDGKELKGFAGRLAAPNQRWEGNFLTEFVRSHTSPGDLIWCPWTSYLYGTTGRLSPTKWLDLFDELMMDTPASTRNEKLAALAGDLMRHPPRMLVFGLPPGRTRASAQALLASASLTKWITGNYWSAIGTADDILQVLILNSPDNTPAARQRVAVELMQAGLDCLYAQGNYREAEIYFRSVLRLNSQYYGAYFQLGKTLDILGRTADARKVWTDFYPMAQRARDNASLEFAAGRLGITLTPPPKPPL